MNIQYNNLNLPNKIYFNQENSKYISYLYTADGIKLNKKAMNGSNEIANIDYTGNIIYDGQKISYIITAEGRLTYNDELGIYNYEYYLQDHLGNTRVVFNQQGEVLQTNSYYPFGMNIESLTTNNQTLSPKNLYLYNGKELQEDFNLNWHDYGARFYDAQIGRWHVIDPMAESRTWLSPYQYAQNSPIMRIDPNGMLDGWIEDENGDVSWDSNTNSKEEFEQNYTDLGKKGYSYVSDADDARAYTLPSGEGTLRMNDWTFDGGDEYMCVAFINMTFVPNFDVDEDNNGWVQTEFNNANENTITTSSQWNQDLYWDEPQEYVDITDSKDPTVSDYYRRGTNISDWPSSIVLSERGINNNFIATSSFVNKGNRIISVEWGMIVNPSGTNHTGKSPKIINNVSDFHNKSINYLPKK